MSILCTFPGKLGDIFWSLATVRAISEAYGEPVDFCCAPAYSAALQVVKAQPYIAHCYAEKLWLTQDTAPLTPPEPPGYTSALDYSKIFHLGYREWPRGPLAKEIYQIACIEKELHPLDLGRPWISVPKPDLPWCEVALGWTDEWAELKMGLTYALWTASASQIDLSILTPPGSRIASEWDTRDGLYIEELNLFNAAQAIATAKLFIGDLSALAVLAAGMGKPRVLVEPNPQRHHPIFQHWDTELVKGVDGLPTFDARHLLAEVKAKLKQIEDEGRSVGV